MILLLFVFCFFTSCDVGLQVYDASLQKTVVSRAYILYATADIRAFPKINKQMQAPAIVGACDQCWQEGSRLPPDNRTVYLGFYRCDVVGVCLLVGWLTQCD
jgi:hypothetical protein